MFFEEWDDPLISGIRWVEELVEIAGGDPIFPELRDARPRQGPHRRSSERSSRRHPDVIIASWCGKPVRTAKIVGAAGLGRMPAVRNGRIYEIKSTYILQPGPAALTEGVRQLQDALHAAAHSMQG